MCQLTRAAPGAAQDDTRVSRKQPPICECAPHPARACVSAQARGCVPVVHVGAHAVKHACVAAAMTCCSGAAQRTAERAVKLAATAQRAAWHRHGEQTQPCCTLSVRACTGIWLAQQLRAPSSSLCKACLAAPRELRLARDLPIFASQALQSLQTYALSSAGPA